MQGLLPHLHAAASKKLQELKVKWKQSSLPGNIDELRKYAGLAPSAEVFAKLGEEHHRNGVSDRAVSGIVSSCLEPWYQFASTAESCTSLNTPSENCVPPPFERHCASC